MNYLRFAGADNVLTLTFFGKDYVINSLDDWEEAVNEIKDDPRYQYDNDLMCSSDIDFPEECTDNAELIDLCYAVRGYTGDVHDGDME